MKFFIITKKNIKQFIYISLIIVFFTIILFISLDNNNSRADNPELYLSDEKRNLIQNLYENEEKVAYLTFDDGPSTTNTPKILDILDKYNIKATFFVLGSSIDANEGAKDILKEEVKRGHAIANHTYGHDYSYLYPGRVMNVKNILSDLEKSQNSMKAVLGKDFSTRVIRFPGGYWSWEGRTAMKEALEQNQYYNVDWNALNKDAEGTKKNAEQLVQCAKESVKALGPDADSVVLLMHDTYGKEETVKALPQIIEYLQSQGFEFRSIK